MRATRRGGAQESLCRYDLGALGARVSSRAGPIRYSALSICKIRSIIPLYKNMKKTLIVLIALAAVVVLWGFSGYNSLVTLNENADAQWAKVETQYQRRFDLIPNLVNSVQAVLTQEQTVFGDLAAARARYSGAAPPDQRAAAASQVAAA